MQKHVLKIILLLSIIPAISQSDSLNNSRSCQQFLKNCDQLRNVDRVLKCYKQRETQVYNCLDSIQQKKNDVIRGLKAKLHAEKSKIYKRSKKLLKRKFEEDKGELVTDAHSNQINRLEAEEILFEFTSRVKQRVYRKLDIYAEKIESLIKKPKTSEDSLEKRDEVIKQVASIRRKLKGQKFNYFQHKDRAMSRLNSIEGFPDVERYRSILNSYDSMVDLINMLESSAEVLLSQLILSKPTESSPIKKKKTVDILIGEAQRVLNEARKNGGLSKVNKEFLQSILRHCNALKAPDRKICIQGVSYE